MERSIVLCDHDLLWDAELKKEFEHENIFISLADTIEDIGNARNIFPYAGIDILVCSVEEFYNFLEHETTGSLYTYSVKNRTSIIVIADTYSADDELTVLRSGCFDYQPRTAPVKTVAQRIRNRLASTLHYKNIYFDRVTNNIYTDGTYIKLTKREQEVLNILLCNKGIPVKKEVILKEVWGSSFNGSIRVIDTVVKQLRQKLSKYNIQIITHYGKGLSVEDKNPPA